MEILLDDQQQLLAPGELEPLRGLLQHAVWELATDWGLSLPTISLWGETKIHEASILLVKAPPPELWFLQTAAGEHRETADGVVSATVYVRSGSKALDVSPIACHELFELFINPSGNRYVQGTDFRFYAMEACDPVENQLRPNGGCNYVLPSYFDPRGKAPFDKMGTLVAPLIPAPTGRQITIGLAVERLLEETKR